VTRITTLCPQCGRVDLGVDDVTLVVSPLEGGGWMLFDCFGCAQRVVQPASKTVALTLSRLRIPLWVVPAEVVERGRSGDDEPSLTIDDALDLVLRLRACENVADLLEGVSTD
jgi:hypothetical protein